MAKRKLTWRGPFKYDAGCWYIGAEDADGNAVFTIHVEDTATNNGARALAKRIGDFLKKEQGRG